MGDNSRPRQTVRGGAGTDPHAGNPWHDPNTGRFTDGPGGNARQQATNSAPKSGNPFTPVAKSAAQNSTDVYTSSIKNINDTERYLGKVIGQNSQCAQLTESPSSVGATRFWTRGQQVRGNEIPIGTPIATFNYYGEHGTNGYAPRGSSGVSGNSHTGIYLYQNDHEIVILNQWHNSGGAVISHIP